MEVSLTFNDDHSVRIHAVSGTVTTQGLCAYLQKLYAAQDFEPGSKVAWDFTDADLAYFNLAEIITLRDFIEKNLARQKPPWSALIVANGIDHDLSKMFETLISSPQIRTRVFVEIDSALQWLANK